MKIEKKQNTIFCTGNCCCQEKMQRAFQATTLILFQNNVWKFITLQMNVKNIIRNEIKSLKQASFCVPALPDWSSHRVTLLLVRTSADAVRSKLRAQQRKSRINGTTQLFRQNSRIRFYNFRLRVIFNLHNKWKGLQMSSLGIYEPLCSLGGGTPSW